MHLLVRDDTTIRCTTSFHRLFDRLLLVLVERGFPIYVLYDMGGGLRAAVRVIIRSFATPRLLLGRTWSAWTD
jgi:hypothetical protein